MPHQSGDHAHAFHGRAGPNDMMRDGRDALPVHPADLRRRGGPRLVHHPSPGGHHHPSPGGHHHPSPGGQSVVHARHLQSGRFAPHPHSPASWYGSVAGSPPHRVPGSSTMSVASSGESLSEEHQHNMVIHEKEAPRDMAAEAMREKERVIREAIQRHMDDDNTIGSNEANAASALLFATSAIRQNEETSKISIAGPKGEGQETANEGEEAPKRYNEGGADGNGEETTAESSMPLKKRRRLLDFLREKPVATATTDKHPLHVSPLHSPQVGARVAGHESSEETVATVSPPRNAGSSSTCFGNGAMLKDAAESSPSHPSQATTEYFPTVLHNVLTSSDVTQNVIQWLPGGKAWKIIRWGALRRKVLPRFFAKLHDEDGKVASSIDAFLWNLSAWGFDEVQSGPDAGAYTHKMFLKDSPDICRQMTFAPKQNEFESPAGAPKKTPSTISEKMHVAAQPHSILQVPSLASTSRSEPDMPSTEAAKSLQWRAEQAKHRMMHSPTIAYPSMAGRPMRHPETPIFMNCGMGDPAYSDGWQYFPESPMGVRRVGSALTGYEPRMAPHPHFDPGMASRTPLALHSPQRVQASRGVLRHAGAGQAGTPLEHTPIRRSSFPVSSRGKGGRSPACRVTVTPCEAARAAPKLPNDEAPEALQKLSEEVAKRVAVAISSKTKRKLPLAASREIPEKVEVIGEGAFCAKIDKKVGESEPVQAGEIDETEDKKGFESVKCVGV